MASERQESRFSIDEILQLREAERKLGAHTDHDDMYKDLMKVVVTSQIQTAEALKNLAAISSKPESAERRTGAASFKVNLVMPTLHDSDFEFWKHWHACQNVARCQTAGAALNLMDFMSLWIPTLLPEGGVRALTVKTHYERACRKGRLPNEVAAVLSEMRRCSIPVTSRIAFGEGGAA